MSEFEDVLVSGEFAAFREAYAPDVRPAGPVAVRETVRRRRRRAALTAAAAVVLAVALPVAANAALGDRFHRPPTPAQSAEPSPSGSTPAPTPSASPSSPPTTANPTPGAPDGRISRAQLLAARLDLTPWRDVVVPEACTSRGVRLDPGPKAGDADVPLLIGDPKYGDVDGDGAAETVALVGCRYGEASAKQLLVFDRDAGRRIITMGLVVATHEGMDDITDFTVADGTVRAHVADIQPCCDTPEWWPQRQWRTYAWTGDRFDQTAGPTKFGTDPRLTDLTLTAGDLVVAPADTAGKRYATVTVTVTNKGPVDVPGVGFAEYFTIGEPAGGDLARCRMTPGDGNEACVLDGLPAGKSRTYTFRFLFDADGPPGGGTRNLRVVHFDEQGRWWSDLAQRNNFVDLRVTQ
ncbi:hypothetical protein [Micromonospora sp. HK10]|uniref:hypothetical protein n=1 Tax=Micromonospora sp. HK10 TaxID=1538294 RepID=UPI0006270499|nr:hypothetical protein [Micromonospora sp. HK10]KKJ94288.1 hypothetical protein LQ51_28220 [Micromonospora sp. HK10]